MRRRTLLEAGSLLPLMRIPAARAATSGMTAKVTMHQGRVTLFIDGKPVQPVIYALTDTPGGRWTWEEIPRENIENFTKAGIALVQVDI